MLCPALHLLVSFFNFFIDHLVFDESGADFEIVVPVCLRTLVFISP